jgi:hypothetical protein
VGIPGALLTADVDDLADVVGIVGADQGYRLRGFFQLGFVGGLYPFFDLVHPLVELVHEVVPGFGVELVEGLVVGAGVLFRASFQSFQTPAIPEHQVMGKLANEVMAFAVAPIGLLGR